MKKKLVNDCFDVVFIAAPNIIDKYIKEEKLKDGIYFILSKSKVETKITIKNKKARYEF